MQQMNESQKCAERIALVMDAIGYQWGNVLKNLEREPFPDYTTSQKWAEILYNFTTGHIAGEEEERDNIPEPMKALSALFVDVLEAYNRLAMRTIPLSQAGAEALELGRKLDRCIKQANEGIEGDKESIGELVNLDRELRELTEEAEKKADTLGTMQQERLELMQAAEEKTLLVNGEFLTLFTVGILEPAGDGPVKKLVKALRSQEQTERRQQGRPGFRVKPAGVKLKLPSWKK